MENELYTLPENCGLSWEYECFWGAEINKLILDGVKVGAVIEGLYVENGEHIILWTPVVYKQLDGKPYPMIKFNDKYHGTLQEASKALVEEILK